MVFDDLNFGPRKVNMSGIQAVVFFENGYGASVVRGYGTYGEDEGLYELAVIKGTSEDWVLCYDTHITDDVIGYLNETEVTEFLQAIEALDA